MTLGSGFYCRVLVFNCLFSQVNGRNILSVDYDRTLRTEKIYDDHRKFLLKIIYDTAGHPVLWVPSSKLLPVNVSRTSTGQISALQRGPTTERLAYDSQGRLISRVFADGKTWSYTYLEQVRNPSFRRGDETSLLLREQPEQWTQNIPSTCKRTNIS